MTQDFLPLTAYTTSNRSPFLITGPCSAETEEQVLETCLALKPLGASVLRAGIWKPRTRPNSFEGHGEKALPWLMKAKALTGLPVCIEVATPAHVELALKYGVDILWIGARTTVNPFSVQAIADAVRGTDTPIWIKNPVNPDLALWIGAIERIYQAGIRKIAVIHRGFSTSDTPRYRNAPMWQLALALKTEMPQLPLIGDPSHMGGKRAYLAELSQKFLDLHYDGLMIESHINPDEAWSDAAQQLTPQALHHLLADLHTRMGKQEKQGTFQNELAVLRQKIDNLDQELIEMLRMRMDLVEQVCDYKIANNVAIFETERWNDIFQSRTAWAEQLQINPTFVEEIYKLIYIESIRKHHEKIA